MILVIALLAAAQLRDIAPVSTSYAAQYENLSEEERLRLLRAVRAEKARRARNRALKQQPSGPSASTGWQIADCVPSVVVVKNSSGLGTGFYVARDVIVTNAHVVGNDSTVLIRRHDGEVSTGNVIAVDVKRDVAAVRVTALGKPLTLAQDDPALGVVVWVVGNPEGLEGSVSRGSVSQVRIVTNGPGDTVRKIQHDAATSPGSSGSPVIMYNGLVVGLHTSTNAVGNSLNFSLHAAELAYFLQKNGIGVGGG